MTKHTDDFLQFAEPVTCREFSLPRDDKSTDPKGWIQGDSKIGPVLEITTSYLQRSLNTATNVPDLGEKTRQGHTFRYRWPLWRDAPPHSRKEAPGHESSMKDPVVPLERNLYGHLLAGLLWERQFEKILLKHGWEKVSNWECLFVHREKGLFLSVYVDDIKIGWKETKS